MNTQQLVFLAAIVVAVVIAHTNAMPEKKQKRGWGDFWQGATVGTLVATAAIGRDADEDQLKARREVVASAPFARRAISLQKRIHWGHALAGVATGAGVVLLGGRDTPVDKRVSEPWAADYTGYGVQV